MKAIRLAWLELRRFRGRLRRVIPVVLILIPLLYGALYLWSNWDPYGRLDRVPVAVVNNDRPVDARGEHIDAGAMFVERLKANDVFAWHFVRPATARRGLEEGRFYFSIEVPRDFSAKLAAAANGNPEHAKVRLVKNDANGYIVGIMADTVQTRLQEQINAAAHAGYARALYGEMGRIRERLTTASEASEQLVNGTELAEQGTDGLRRGLGGVRDGTGMVSRGAQDVSSAVEQLDARLTGMADFAAGQLPEAVNSLVHASEVAVNALTRITAAADAVQRDATEGLSAVQRLGERHPQLRGDPTYQQALRAASRVSDSANAADAEARRALSDATDANRRALALQSSVGPLQQRVWSMTAPLDTLRTGTGELAAGASAINGGMDTLTSSSDTLRTGAGQLNDGATQLQKLVDDALRRLPPTNPTEVARATDVLGSPAQISTSNLNPAHVYGRGLAPFFFAIALWVFGLFAYLLLRPVNLRALADRVNAWTIMLAGLLPAAALGVLGGLVLFVVVDYGLGLNPVHLWWTVGLISLAAVTFTAIDHFLRTAFGTIGDLASLVLLVLQLTAAGGLYPMETSPAFFQAIHPFLPMTYLIDGLRVTISGGLTTHLLRDTAVLAGVLVVFLLATTITVQRRRTWTIARLHPQLELA
ncbi:YhgE/Pip domain-containing protein [Saccharopolyspora halophila]|uniref:YhgE/Pip domain-containing protein n=1 Tax=Saccharopolyspora halophila TaxID=405551 RepID=A0ABN3FSZ0_9PSEU